MKKLTLIIFMAVLFIPTKVNAEEDLPIIKWENLNINTTEQTVDSEKFIGILSDGYLVLNDKNEIVKYSLDGKKEGVIIKDVPYSYIFTDNADNIVIISYYDNKFYKCSKDGELIVQNDLKDIEEFEYLSARSSNNNEYYSSSFDIETSYKYIEKIDTNGNVIKDYRACMDCDINFNVTKDNNVILINEYYDNSNVEVMLLDSNLNVIFKKEILNQDIESFYVIAIEATEDGYILAGRYADYGSVIVKLNKELNIEWNKFYDTTLSYFEDVAVLSDDYVAIYNEGSSGSTIPKIIKYDKDGNVLYEQIYKNEIYKEEHPGYEATNIIALEDDDYLVTFNFGYNGYNTGAGTGVVRYGYKDYKITPNIIGKGTITFSSNKSKAGKTITYEVTPDNGYILKSVTIKTASGDNVETTNNSFIMPKDDVIVEAEFVKELTENPNTNSMILIIIGIVLISILGTVVTIFYRKIKNQE